MFYILSFIHLTIPTLKYFKNRFWKIPTNITVNTYEFYNTYQYNTSINNIIQTL